MSIHISRRNDQRLEYPMLADGGGQVFQFFGMQHAARLARVGEQLVHWNQDDAILCQHIFPARDEGSQTTSKSGFLGHSTSLCHPTLSVITIPSLFNNSHASSSYDLAAFDPGAYSENGRP